MVVGADVVDLAGLALVQEQVQRLAVVFDEEPVADLLAVAVDRQRQVLQGVRARKAGSNFSTCCRGPTLFAGRATTIGRP